MPSRSTRMWSVPLILALAALTLGVAIARADPGVRVDVLGGAARIELLGSFVGARYTVSRGDVGATTLAPISATDALCTGDCFVFDAAAQIGGTYQYRFDVLAAGGTWRSYGPYTVTIGAPVTGFAVRALAMPFRGGGVLRLSAGEPGASHASGLAGRVTLHDVSGRLVRELYQGTLEKLTLDVAWDGRDASGTAMAPGVYLARFQAGTHVSTARVVLTR